MDEDFDKLFEALTIEKILEEPRGGLHGGYSVWRYHETNFAYWWYGRVLPGASKDIAYRDKDGKYHKTTGPAYISRNYGVQEWYKHGVRHREDGPAIDHKGNQYWLKDGKLHRLDGPAVVTFHGPKEYWINGAKLPPKEYKKEIARRKRKGLIK